MNSLAETITFDCDVCNQSHDLPLNLGFSMPDLVTKLLPWEKAKRCQLSDDWCILDERFFYLRGCLEVPIKGTGKIFSWGVWTTVSEDDFDATMELWNDANRVSEPDYKGSLANTMPTYLETRNLPVLVRTRAVGDRPLLYVAGAEHNLGVDQRDGMSMERAVELAKLVLHNQGGSAGSSQCER